MNLLDKIEVAIDAIPMEIKDLDGNPLTEVEAEKPTIYLFGMDSEVFRNSVKDLEEGEGHKLIAKCVSKWENIKDSNGLDMECNFDNALALLKKYPIIYSQADKFIADRANYLKK